MDRKELTVKEGVPDIAASFPARNPLSESGLRASKQATATKSVGAPLPAPTSKYEILFERMFSKILEGMTNNITLIESRVKDIQDIIDSAQSVDEEAEVFSHKAMEALAQDTEEAGHAMDQLAGPRAQAHQDFTQLLSRVSETILKGELVGVKLAALEDENERQLIEHLPLDSSLEDYQTKITQDSNTVEKLIFQIEDELALLLSPQKKKPKPVTIARLRDMASNTLTAGENSQLDIEALSERLERLEMKAERGHRSRSHPPSREGSYVGSYDRSSYRSRSVTHNHLMSPAPGNLASVHNSIFELMQKNAVLSPPRSARKSVQHSVPPELQSPTLLKPPPRQSLSEGQTLVSQQSPNLKKVLVFSD